MCLYVVVNKLFINNERWYTTRVTIPDFYLFYQG